ncbi:MAG: antibiotic biosynthesis monooxygenase [Eubacteriaceae bacterium]|nr:antibiotic biosynthesis monooxygenase [Eubacteriaceae bacterium]
MIIVHADLHAVPGKEKEMIEKAKPLIDGTLKEEGCLFYSLFRDTVDECLFRFVEGWASQEALDLHGETDHFQTILPQLVELTDKDPDIKSYEIK